MTEFTSFVAVDSSAVTGQGGSNNDGSGGDDGAILDWVDHDTDRSLIKVVGTISGAEGMLRLKLDKWSQTTYKPFSLQHNECWRAGDSTVSNSSYQRR